MVELLIEEKKHSSEVLDNFTCNDNVDNESGTVDLYYNELIR